MRSGQFDAAWALGVVSTVPDKDRFFSEVRRVLGPSGRLGLLEYVVTGSAPFEPPAGNDFATPAELADLLRRAGFVVIGTASGDELPSVPLAWQAPADQVKEAVATAHPGSRLIDDAEAQERRFADLIDDGALALQLLHAVAA